MQALRKTDEVCIRDPEGGKNAISLFSASADTLLGYLGGGGEYRQRAWTGCKQAR